MGRIDEWAMRRMCENLNLECFYDAFRMVYVFRRKLDPGSVADQLEYCFSDPEREFCMDVYYLRQIDTIRLYRRLQEEFGS